MIQLEKERAAENCHVSLYSSKTRGCHGKRHDGNRVRPKMLHEARLLRQCRVRRVAVKGVAQLAIVDGVVTKGLEGASRSLWDQALTSH